MRRIFVSATAMAALCSLVVSVAPALGLEFEGEATYSKRPSTTAQIIHLGTSRWVECAKMEMTASPKVGAFTKLPISLEDYAMCTYNREMVSEVVEPISLSCGITLESADLVELTEEEFGEGRAKFGCTLEFQSTSHSGGCKVEVYKPGAAQPEFTWVNLDGESGHYDSLIELKLKNLEYNIEPSKAGAVCKSSTTGSNGEYDGSAPVERATIFPEF